VGNKFTRNLKVFMVGVCLIVLFVCLASCTSEYSWKPTGGRMMSRWAGEVSPDNVLPEYPRPMMVRDKWLNLNGLWDYAITNLERVDGRILVPFPMESALSGVARKVTESDRLWYRRMFEVPKGWAGERVLLHFGAVDWETDIFVNGKQIGTHRGGYDPFTFDITDALKPAGPQEITVAVWDPTENGHQPRGKQTLEPHGFWYTAVTGIWQTVWLEPVPPNYIENIEITPDIDTETVMLVVHAPCRRKRGKKECSGSCKGRR